MNSSHPKGSNKDMVEWYEFNAECMVKKGIEIPIVDDYKDINNSTFFIPEVEELTTIIEEGAESCPRCKGKKTISIDVQKRSADEGMTTMFECSECQNKWQI